MRLRHLKLARQSGWKKGYPRHPVFMDMDAWDNRHWRGWKPRDTPRMPPKGSVSVEMQQSNPPSAHTQATGQLQPPPRGIDHEELCKDLNEMPLPCDDAERASFDQQDVFILGDPAASFDRSGGHSYDRKSSNPHAGFPEWKKIFSYILRDCGYLVDYDTVYVLVDTRDLANHAVRDPGLPHWQAAVAWWESRLQMTGPMGERTELCFFPASEHTGLHNVHPTWAGTFVLAALGASFPGKHSSCWIAIAYQLHFSKLLIYGRKPTLPDFHWVLRSPANYHIPCSNTNVFNVTVMSKIHGKVHPIRRWGKAWC